MSQIIVLGWDALDVELIEEFGLSGRFGIHQRKLETYVNPATGEPHTKELWPSMITGLHPDEHGIHAVTKGGGVEWGDPLINTASNIANGLVPQSLLSLIGSKLRERGASMNIKRQSYYPQHDIHTVFSDKQAQPISIPNYQTAFDRKHELDANRDGVWAELLVNRDETEGYEPDLSISGVYDILGREMGKRLGHTLTAINSGYSLVWTWFGLIDTVGHMAPAIRCDIERDWYTAAANATETIQETAPGDATILVVSDHGLQNGSHTHYASLCTNNPEAADAIDSIYDITDWITKQDPTATTETSRVDSEAMDGVEEQLENLGYV